MNIVELHKDRMQDSFSKDFLWGAAISAKQAEGDSDRALTVADLQNYDSHDKAKVKGDLSLQEIMDRIEHPQDYIFPIRTVQKKSQVRKVSYFMISSLIS